MNIALLILGIVIIVLSTVLIVLNSNKAPDKAPDSTFETYSPKPNIKNARRHTDENIFYEKIRDQVLESPIRKTNITTEEPVKQKIASGFEAEKDQFERDILREDIVDKEIETTEDRQYIEVKADIFDEIYESEYEVEVECELQKRLSVTQDEESITEKIIQMKQNGMTNNEIAKSLDKGVREVEIILKINKINN